MTLPAKYDENRPSTDRGLVLNQRYFPEIDGLRAIAVLLVILNHLAIPGFAAGSGGFIGVDIFFVISGFLITGILNRDVEQQRLSLSKFFWRRFRRLYPALAVTVFFTFWVGAAILTPAALQELGLSVLAGLGAVSNIFFWLKSGYFDVAATFKPLLHTWSLGVEEQFYLLWSAIFALVFWGRSSRFKVGAIVVSGVFSLTLNLCYLSSPSAMYYLMPFRMYEFVLGALLNWVLPYWRPSKYWSQFVALVGASLIYASIRLIGPQTIFPSYVALLPCLGAGLLILSVGSAALIARLLRSEPLRQIGLVSYSLYLVHWPILVFVKILGGDVSRGQKIITLLAILVSGFLLSKLVEQPLRYKSWPRVSKGARLALATALVAIAFIPPYLVQVQDGWAWRFPPDFARLIQNTQAAALHRHLRGTHCYFSDFRDFDATECLGLDKSKVNILVWGDSSADYSWHGIESGLSAGHYNVLQYTSSGCSPGLHWGQGQCRMANEYIAQFIINNKIDLILIGSQGRNPENFRHTLRWLHDEKQRVVVLGHPFLFEPQMAEIVRPYNSRSITPLEINSKAIAAIEKNDIEHMNDLAGLAREANFPYYDIRPQLCRDPRDPASCNFIVGDTLLTLDRLHLSPEASAKIFAPLTQAIRATRFNELISGQNIQL